MIYGYARVSHKDQNLDRQYAMLHEYVPDSRNIIMDKASGKDFERKGWHLLVGSDSSAPMLREGDLLVVLSLDRLGRNYDEIRKEWQRITQEIKADIKVLDMPLLDTTQRADSLDNRFVADLVLQILSYVSEKERQSIRERQRQGIEIAKAEGKYKGRKPKPVNEELFRSECKKWRDGLQTATQTFRNCGMTKSYFYLKVKEYGF